MFAQWRPISYMNNGYNGQMYGLIDEYRSQPVHFPAQFPFQPGMPQQEWNPMPLPESMMPMQNFMPYGYNYQPGPMTQKGSFNHQVYTQKDSQFLFQNPLQTKEEMMPKSQMPMNGYPLMNPYPKQSFISKPPSGMQSIINSFKSQDGTVDFNKMINTAGQMANAVTQVSSLIKGFGGIFKT
ncbi:YppG family protein [Bacillus rubiinfantis]|uniref:YppG family protein n=1 Tax=Bacillus rubiinfantis TaxID=1499680 RepID=UPI0006948EBF|nr:YppG family protein [Bacillus rubiinfantis]